MSDSEGLPKGWMRCRLSELAEIITGNTPPTSRPEFYGGDVPFVTPSDLVDRPIGKTRQTISETGIPQARTVPAEAILVSCIGNLGKTGITARPSAFNQQLNGVVFKPGVAPAYGFYACQCLKRYLEEVASATTIAIVNKSKFSDATIPVAPLGEQRRIVAKIEELFSDLDAGVAALRRVKANLKRYRAAVLNAAVTGKLTAEWRKLNPPTESVDKLLARILEERRKKWERDQLQNFRGAGKTAPTNWKEKYPIPVPVNSDELPSLPDRWVWTSLDAITHIAGGITKGQRHSPGTQLREVAYLRVANVQRGFLDLSEMKSIPATEADIVALRLRQGDILFNEGGDRDKLGRGWIWNEELPECIHQNHVFRARPLLPELKSKFISFHGNSFGQQWFLRTGKQSVNLASINMGVLRRFPVPLPPAEEQAQIVAEVDRRLSVVDAAETEVEHGLKRAARLRQAILKRAFEGKLVPQDPSDEPASVMVGRIASVGKEKHEKRRPAKMRA